MELLYNFLHNIFSFIVVLTIIVFVHEYGHYKAAKLVGVMVKSFSIGMGKEIYGWFNKEGTRFKISLLPIGGYVSLFGHNEMLSNSKYNPRALTEVEKSYAFDFKSIPERIFIVISGPFANFLLGFVLLFSLHMVLGYKYFPPVIGSVAENYPAKAAGLMAGDVINEINGVQIKDFGDVQAQIFLTPEGESIKLKIDRNGQDKTFTIKPKHEKVTDIAGYEAVIPKIGISNANQQVKKIGILENAKVSINEIKDIIINTYKGLSQIILGERSPKEIGGVIKIAEYSGKSTSQGFERFILFVVILSVNLGFINLLPIPGLDGGYIVLYLLEMVVGKNIADSINKKAIKLGVAILISLFIFTTYNDVTSLIAKILS